MQQFWCCRYVRLYLLLYISNMAFCIVMHLNLEKSITQNFTNWIDIDCMFKDICWFTLDLF